MDVSFEEKSVWIQLISTFVVLGYYFVVAWNMLSNGILALPVFVPVFTVAVVAMVVVNVVGHITVAIVSRPDGADERDRLIGWRAESNSSWILAVGVLTAITGLIISIDTAWIAHLLLLSLFVSEIVKFSLQLVYYRRGM